MQLTNQDGNRLTYLLLCFFNRWHCGLSLSYFGLCGWCWLRGHVYWRHSQYGYRWFEHFLFSTPWYVPLLTFADATVATFSHIVCLLGTGNRLCDSTKYLKVFTGAIRQLQSDVDRGQSLTLTGLKTSLDALLTDIVGPAEVNFDAFSSGTTSDVTIEVVMSRNENETITPLIALKELFGGEVPTNVTNLDTLLSDIVPLSDARITYDRNLTFKIKIGVEYDSSTEEAACYVVGEDTGLDLEFSGTFHDSFTWVGQEIVLILSFILLYRNGLDCFQRKPWALCWKLLL